MNIDPLPSLLIDEAGDEESEYFPTADQALPDDPASSARYPARVVRDAVAMQERKWGLVAPEQDTATGQD